MNNNGTTINIQAQTGVLHYQKPLTNDKIL